MSKSIFLALAVSLAAPMFAVGPVAAACDPPPVIINQLPRMSSGWSGSVAWYNDKIYEVADSTSYANIKNPVTGVQEGRIYFGSWAMDDTKGFTYDAFRNTFWVKVGQYAYQVAVTGGAAISTFPCQRQGFAFGIWKEPTEENSMWIADPVYAQVRKVDMRDGSLLQTVNTDFNVRGVSRVGDTLWCVRAGEPGDAGVILQINMQGDELCKFYLPSAKYMHDAGGCDIDPEGYLWVEGGKSTAIYQIDIGNVMTTPTPAKTPAPNPTPTTTPPVTGHIDSGDYDGDGTSDIAIYRPAIGIWAVRGLTRVYYGLNDLPVSGDYNGDGTSDIAVFRPASARWSVRGITRFYFGAAGDFPLPGNYTSGDRAVEAAVFRRTSGLWAVRGVTRFYWGASGDLPVPGYYLAGHIKRAGVFRPENARWAIRGVGNYYFGSGIDTPVVADLSGDGVDEIGIFRQANGLWAVRGWTRQYFGGWSDQPVPAAYTGAAASEVAVFRPSLGRWLIRGVTSPYFGKVSGDLPVAGPACNPSSAGII